jgi:hypothetical protein
MAARFEYRRISERQLEKNQELRRQGGARGRPAAPTPVADEVRAARAAGRTFRAIAADLNARAVPTRQGGRAWYASSVRFALVARERELDASADARATGAQASSRVT